MLVRSTGYNQHEIIKDIIKLHTGNIECDVTYSKGNFYKHGIKEPKFKFDIKPQTEDTIQASADKLPVLSGTLKNIMFDPPFLATTGKSLEVDNKSNVMLKRFGVFSTEKKLFEFYTRVLKESYRVLKPGGYLVVKCQDKVSSGKQYFSHVYIMNEAEKAGFYCKDLFVLLAKSRLVANWQIKNQKHARKYHSYFLVFVKKWGRK